MLSYSGTTGRTPVRKVVGTGSRGGGAKPARCASGAVWPVARYDREGSQALAL